MTGMGSHHSPKSASDEWLTPPEIISALGPFELDPCAPVNRPWDTARRHYTIEDDPALPWEGRVWLNPPYGRETGAWLSRLADHGRGTALIFARTETDMFFEQVWKRATGIKFLRGRLHFHHIDGTRAKYNSGAPSCLISYGESDDLMLRISKIDGHYVRIAPLFDKRNPR